MMKELKTSTTALIAFLSYLAPLHAACPDAPISARDWFKNNPLETTCRYAEPDSRQFHIYHDGTPNSPFVKFVDEMRYWGFTGIEIIAPIAGDVGSDSKFRTRLNPLTKKWEMDKARIDHMKQKVDLALDRGLYVTMRFPVPKYEWTDEKGTEHLPHNQRLTPYYIKIQLDLLEQFAEAFKDYSHRVAFVNIPEVHMWEYENSLPQSHSDYIRLSSPGYFKLYNKYCNDWAKIVRKSNPTRLLNFNLKTIAQLKGENGATVDFPFAGDPPPESPGPLYYAFTSSNFGNHSRDWEWWGCDHEYYTKEKLLENIQQPIEVIRPFMTQNRNVGALMNNWGSCYSKDPKPPSSPSEPLKWQNAFQQYREKEEKYREQGKKMDKPLMLNEWDPNKKRITDYQSLQLAFHMMDLLKANHLAYRYQDLDAERQIYDHTTQSVPQIPAVEMFLEMNREKMSFNRRVYLQSSSGGSISHSLKYPHREAYICRIGSTHKIEAVPEAGYRFNGWSGSVVSDRK